MTRSRRWDAALACGTVPSVAFASGWPRRRPEVSGLVSETVPSEPVAEAATVDALLPGELARSDRLDDAIHWAAVYAELTRFLLEVEAGAPAPSPTLARYTRRLEYWRGRLAELGGRPVAGPEAW